MIPVLHAVKPDSDDINLQLWLFRLLFRLGAHKQFITAGGLTHTLLSDYFSLTHYENQSFTPVEQQNVLDTLLQRYRELERQPASSAAPSASQQAIEQLARRIGLTKAEQLIFEFTIKLQHERLLDDAAEWLGLLSSSKVYGILATLLDQPQADIRHALGPTSLLTQTGLVTLETSGLHSLGNKLEPFSLTLAERLSDGESDPARLLQGIVTRCERSHLTFDHYAHLPTINIIRQWLHYAQSSRRPGVNILIYGQPGSGKSQLCRLLAQELGSELYEIASENESSRLITGSRRLRAWQAAQRFFAGDSALILLDEAEDVFSDSAGSFSSPASPLSKAWINRLLEENRVPGLWVSNDISAMDPAFIRRFDIVLELDVPPRQQREALLKQACDATLAPGDLAQLVSHRAVTPAIIERAANVTGSLTDRKDGQKRAQYLMFLINNTLKAQGHMPIKKKNSSASATVYDPSFISSDSPVSDIAAALSAEHSARLCLYGPPGTGKTAWAHWLAQQLKMPVVEIKASQLMSPYVGESEQNIAAIFAQARREDAMLLIDETDTFLADREACQQRWELSCVNEMLSQIEHYNGILITTTNRFEVLDAAALRRFDLKIRFSYLCDYQAVALLNLYCEQLQLDRPSTQTVLNLTKLTSLTPGDFTVVSRQHTFRPLTSASAFVAALKAECWLKKRDKPAIGFLH